MEKLITIVGPTAVGKTDLTIALAKKYNTSVISGDAYQVYRDLNIGTAKPTLEERQGVHHYLIDILNYNDSYNVATFQKEASDIIKIENSKSNTPILSGGTGLYVQALLEGYQFTSTAPNQDLRDKLNALYDEKGIEGLYEYAQILAKPHNINLPYKDKHRLFRTIELLTEGNIEGLKSQTKQGLSYDGPVIGLRRERSELYKRINLRVDIMVEQGLFEEVESLLKSGLDIDAQSMKGIGYKEVVSYLNGNLSKDDCINLIKQNTRHFAKRQITWYKRMPYIQWIDIASDTSSSEVFEKAVNIIEAWKNN